jgi:RNA polymerase sigma factor (sigma-70 family)
MAAKHLNSILVQLRRWIGPRTAAQSSDGQLLERFAARRDEDAFAVLVERHGPMVLGLCRRILHDCHEAEDVFQAVFLILARKAVALDKRRSLAPWLYTVAYRLALRARRSTAKRQARERQTEIMPPTPTETNSTWRDLRPVLDDELSKLPEKYRAPLVLCYLQGRTYEETAQHLGWPKGTVAIRLARGRDLLRERLTRRGVTLAAGLVGLELGGEASASVPTALVHATVQAATSFAAGGTATTAAAVLSQGAMQGMVMQKVAWVGAAVILLGAIGVAIGVVDFQATTHRAEIQAAKRAPAFASKADDEPAKSDEGRVDLYGDPLPRGAVARLGSMRLRHAGLSDFALVPDGKTILTVGRDRILRSWDMATGKQIRTVKLEGTANLGWGTLLSTEGKIAAALAGDDVLFWKADTGKLVRTFPAPQVRNGGVCLSDDGKILALCTQTPEVVLWDWETAKTRAIPLHQRQIGLDSTFHCSFSPDGRWLIAGGGSREQLQVFETATGREIYHLECYASASAVSPDGKQVAVASMVNDQIKSETVIRLFETDTGKETAQYPLGHENHYLTLCYSPDGRVLACGFSDQSCLLDCASGRVLNRLPGRPLGMYFTSDGKTLIFSDGHRLHLFDVATGQEQSDRPGEFGYSPTLAISPNGNILAASDWMERAVSLWDVKKGQLLRQLPVDNQDRRYVRNVEFSAEGQTVISCDYHGLLQFYDITTGKDQRRVQLLDPNHPNKDHVYFYQLHVWPGGKRIGTLERIMGQPESTRLAIWDLATGNILSEFSLPAETRAAAWWIDGSKVAVTLDEGLTVLKADTGTVVYRIAGVRRGEPLTLSPDNRYLAAPRRNKAQRAMRDDENFPVDVGVWDAVTGKEVVILPTGKIFHYRQNAVVDVIMGARLTLADSRTLVTTDEEFLHVWDLTTGQERRRYPLPVAMTDAWGQTLVTHLITSPDGRRAITSLADGTALVWNLDSHAPAKP